MQYFDFIQSNITFYTSIFDQKSFENGLAEIQNSFTRFENHPFSTHPMSERGEIGDFSCGNLQITKRVVRRFRGDLSSLRVPTTDKTNLRPRVYEALE